MPVEPWIALGDFNNVIYKLTERSDYHLEWQWPIVHLIFQEYIDETDLVDIFSDGPYFTWSNKRKDDFIVKKLDMILVNAQWLDGFLTLWLNLSHLTLQTIVQAF